MFLLFAAAGEALQMRTAQGLLTNTDFIEFDRWKCFFDR
jgi:hypothetical protein